MAINKEEIKKKVEEQIIKSLHFEGNEMLWPYTGTDGEMHFAHLSRSSLLKAIIYPRPQDLEEAKEPV